jgi:hypothetical protein
MQCLEWSWDFKRCSSCCHKIDIKSVIVFPRNNFSHPAFDHRRPRIRSPVSTNLLLRNSHSLKFKLNHADSSFVLGEKDAVPCLPMLCPWSSRVLGMLSAHPEHLQILLHRSRHQPISFGRRLEEGQVQAMHLRRQVSRVLSLLWIFFREL